MLLMIIQLLVVLLALYVGSRYGSLALGAISGIGIAVLVFGFGMKPGTPPTDVIYIIVAAVTCAGALQAAGGMDWLIQIAERMLRKHPDHITFLAPFCTFFLTVLIGTGHVVYTLMPIICDISLRKGIRPERPCAVASIASQVGITCSPIAAAVVAAVAISNMHGYDITIPKLLMVTLPASMVGLALAALMSYRRGRDLDDDPEFQRRLADAEMREYMFGDSATTLDRKISPAARRSVYIFLGAIVVIVFFASFQSLLPSYQSLAPVAGAADVTLPDGSVLTPAQLVGAGVLMEGVTEYVSRPLALNLLIQIVMIVAAASMFIFCGASPKRAVTGAVWQSGMVAVVAIYGIAWLADTYFSGYLDMMKTGLGGIIAEHNWTIALIFFVVSILINSQGAVVVAMLPLAYSMGIPGWVSLGVLPSVYGYFFLPNYPSDIATVQFDRSGTTRIGKYLLNHSFMMPGLVCVIAATIISYFLALLLW